MSSSSDFFEDKKIQIIDTISNKQYTVLQKIVYNDEICILKIIKPVKNIDFLPRLLQDYRFVKNVFPNIDFKSKTLNLENVSKILFDNEVKTHQLAEDLAPKIYDYFYKNDKTGIIIMEKIDITLEETIKILNQKNPELIICLLPKFIKVYDKLSKLIHHSDLHTENIMLKLDGPNYNIKIIDYGLSFKNDNGKYDDIYFFYLNLQELFDDELDIDKNISKKCLKLIYDYYNLSRYSDVILNPSEENINIDFINLQEIEITKILKNNLSK